jgi:energy-coupling factor transporter transmembrane protein EcfT
MILITTLINASIYFLFGFFIFKSIVFIRKKEYKKLLKVVNSCLVVCLLSICFLSYDIYRIKNDKSPRFSIEIGHLKDGGSIQYSGLGYTLWKIKSLWQETINNQEVHGYLRGYEIQVAFITVFEKSEFVPDE